MSSEEENEGVVGESQTWDTSEESHDDRGPTMLDVKEYVITTKQEKVEIPKERDAGSKIYIHKCPVMSCGYSSRTRSHVREHYKTHSGEKPFQCKICDKKFANKGNCETHIRTHDDKFKFKCHVCVANFAEYRNLEKHCRAKHNIDEMPGIFHYRNGRWVYYQNGSPRYFRDEEW